MTIVDSNSNGHGASRMAEFIASPWRQLNGSEAGALFLISQSHAPCGVESFARRTAQHWRQLGLRGRSLAVTGEPADIAKIWRALDASESIVINFPVVAWKKMLLTPLFAFVLALLRGRKTVAVIHEWDDLDWRRRLLVGLYALLAQAIVFSSPMVREQFRNNPLSWLFTGQISVTTIPANVDVVTPQTKSPLATRLAAMRAEGKTVIAHFGSIYPKKQSDFVLDVMTQLKHAGKDVFAVFVGSFVKGCDDVEARFSNKLQALGLENDVLVTGYIESEEDVFGLFDEVDCFVYRFADGLSSRRSSVLASLQSGRPVVVNAPDTADEFTHHRIFREFLDRGGLQLVSREGEASDYAAAIIESAGARSNVDRGLFHEAWRDAVRAIAIATDPALASSVVFSERRKTPRVSYV